MHDVVLDPAAADGLASSERGGHGHAGHDHGGGGAIRSTNGYDEGTGDVGGSRATAQAIGVGEQVFATIGSETDADYFVVNLTAGISYTIEQEGLAHGGDALIDPYLYLYGPSGALVAQNDDAAYPYSINSQIVFTASTSGAHYVRADAFDSFSGDDTGDYRLQVYETANPPVPAGSPLDALHWQTYTAPSVINVHFVAGGTSVTGDAAGDRSSYTTSGWDATELAAAERAFAEFSEVANVAFNFVADPGQADFLMIEAAGAFDTGFGLWNVGAEFDQAITLNGRTYSNLEGWGQFNPLSPGWNANGLQDGGLGYALLLHEIGHGMGLAHPHDDGGNSAILPGVFDPFADTGLFDLNQGISTVMTYNDGWVTAPHGLTPSDDYGMQGSLMALDIAQLQATYGANTATRTGDDVYVLPGASGVGIGYQAIWDAGGIDTIEASGATRDLAIDLRAATLDYSANGGGFVSHQTGVHGGYTIAAGTVIENATAGSGNDILVGNAASNVIVGGAGDDTFYGAASHGAGYGFFEAAGRTYIVDAVADTVDTLIGVETVQSGPSAFQAAQIADFDPLAYIASNPDLMAAFGADEGLGILHYVGWGLGEGRNGGFAGEAGFDAAAYLANYGDLAAAFGDNAVFAAQHYIGFGLGEGRLGADPYAYIASHADLTIAFRGLSDTAMRDVALSHFAAAGRDEGRQLGVDFDAGEYVANYGDLAGAFGGDETAATLHFIRNGYGEGRLSLDALTYIASHDDLTRAFAGIDDEAALRAAGLDHYHRAGFAEGRSTDAAFDVDAYLAGYADLRPVFLQDDGTYDEAAATYHYISRGFEEGRNDDFAY